MVYLMETLMKKNIKHEQEPVQPKKREKMVGGRRVQVYMDARSLYIASQLGGGDSSANLSGGNISSGIRRALDMAGTGLPTQKQPDPE